MTAKRIRVLPLLSEHNRGSVEPVRGHIEDAEPLGEVQANIETPRG